MGEREPLNENDEEHRRALLEYYNSAAMTHGGYIIALTVGLFTLISRWDIFRDDILMKVIFYIIVSLSTGFGAYLCGKLVFWSMMSHTLLHTHEFLFPKGNMPKDTTRIFQLQKATIRRIETRAKNTKDPKWRYYRIIKKFDSLNIPFILCITFITLSMFGIAQSVIKLVTLGVLDNLLLLFLVVSVAGLVISLIMLYQTLSNPFETKGTSKDIDRKADR